MGKRDPFWLAAAAFAFLFLSVSMPFVSLSRNDGVLKQLLGVFVFRHFATSKHPSAAAGCICEAALLVPGTRQRHQTDRASSILSVYNIALCQLVRLLVRTREDTDTPTS